MVSCEIFYILISIKYENGKQFTMPITKFSWINILYITQAYG